VFSNRALILASFISLTLNAQTMQDAILRQRNAIRKQANAVHGFKDSASDSFFTHPWPIPQGAAAADPQAKDIALARPPDCDPIPQAQLQPMVAGAARKEGIDPRIVQGVMQQESGFKPCAESPKGAMGLMQLMPSTASQLAVSNPWDPEQNIFAGARYLKQLIDRYKGDLPLALGAYNAGPGRVDAAGGVPAIAETQNYVNSIMSKLPVQ
jgi:soluble lytic murein transglycosylase-like protein